MAAIEVRFIAPEEHREWLRAEQRSFGIEPDDERLDQLAPVVEAGRACAAFDDGAIVATGAAFGTDLTLPGRTTARVGAVTAIGTRPTHYRRGLFRRIMALLHEQSADMGETATVLLASESLLYPRFGYGPATTAAAVRLDRRRAKLRDDLEISDRVSMFADVAGSAALISDIWKRAGADRPGWIDRPDRLLRFTLADHEVERHDAMAYTLALHHDADGNPDGYCLYRRSLKWQHGQSVGSLFVDELVAVDSTAHLALWQHCLGIDLVETIEAFPVPVDDPLPEALADRRQYATTDIHDQLWLRPHDPAMLLASRRYAVADALRLQVRESGTYLIEGGPDAASCQPTDHDGADLVCGTAELGAILLGNSIRPFVATGRVELADPSELDRLDHFLRWPVAPYNLLDF